MLYGRDSSIVRSRGSMRMTAVSYAEARFSLQCYSWGSFYPLQRLAMRFTATADGNAHTAVFVRK